MIDEIKLFRSMVKYHATVIGWLIKNEKVEKLNDKLALFKEKEMKPQYATSYKGEVFLSNRDGSKRISGSCWDKDFTKFKLLSGNIKDLVDEGFEIFDIGNTCDRYCLTSQLGDLLVRHYDILGDVSFPEGFPRLKGKEAAAYLNLVKSEQAHPLGDGENHSLEAKNDRNRAEKTEHIRSKVANPS